jgi:hypothetical protein
MLPSRIRISILLLVLAVGIPVHAAAQQYELATLSANFGGLAKLSFSTTSITFPSSDPDTSPQVAATPGPITITAKARATRGATVRLTVLASDNLRSGVNTIAADAITWTATGTGFSGGTLSRTTAQTVGSWIGSGARTGTQQYLFRNLWTYIAGTYTLTLQYTLSTP